MEEITNNDYATHTRYNGLFRISFFPPPMNSERWSDKTDKICYFSFRFSTKVDYQSALFA